MDNLARNAMLAKQAGMSYGRWKAMQPVAKIEKPPIPDGWRECKHCGKPFKPAGGGQKFCDLDCRRKASYEQRKQTNKERMRVYRAMKKESKDDESKT